MPLSPELIALGQYLAGEFENQEQALAQPAWYVNLRLWQRPVPIFSEDSIALYAEQANVLKLDQPYRPRLLRLRGDANDPQALRVEYYMFKDLEAIRGAGANPERLQCITTDSIEFLPGCTLNLQTEQIAPGQYCFRTFSAPECRCCFTYQGQLYQVSLGFEVTSKELQVYDRGINPTTGQAIWGALLGPYRFQKCQD
jgi:hypothetical protein